MNSNITVNIFWWEGVALIFTVIAMLSFIFKPRGNLTKDKRKKIDILFTLLPSIPAMVFGLYSFFNNKNGVVPSLFAMGLTTFAVFMKKAKY